MKNPNGVRGNGGCEKWEMGNVEMGKVGKVGNGVWKTAAVLHLVSFMLLHPVPGQSTCSGFRRWA